MMQMKESKYDFEELQGIIRRLCAPDGCPWDRIQTHESLKASLMDEAQEAIQAIDHQDMENLCEELGDVLLVLMLHAEVAAKAGIFTMEDVIDGISRKMVRRHPHVFGDAKADTPEESLILWRQIKAQEKKEKQSRCAKP